MPRPSPLGDLSDVSSRVLSMALAALALDPRALTAVTAGLPALAGEAGHLNLVVAATPCAAPMFTGAVTRLCAVERRDVLLVRTGLHPELFDPVTADAALVCGGEAVLLTGQLFYRAANGALWLVPGDGGGGVRGAVELVPSGLTLQLRPPYADGQERVDGLARAAAEVKRRFLRGQAR